MMEQPSNNKAAHIKELITFHEPILIISKLRDSSLSKHLLWEAVHKSQEAKWQEAHSRGNFEYWLKTLKDSYGIIEEHNGEIRLTKIGQWVANTTNDKIEPRRDFIYSALCKTCTTSTFIVLFVPIMGTARIRKGTYNIKFSIDAECPQCKSKSVIEINGIGSEEDFRKFYDKAAAVLSCSC